MKKLALLAALAFVIAVVGPAAAVPDVGQPAVNFTLKNVATGKDFVLESELKKSKMLFTWFSSTCSTCQAEIAEIKSAIAAGDIGKDVTVSFINIDFNDANIVAYQKSQGIEGFNILHDPKFTTPLLYGFRSTPATLIIGKDGNVAFRKVGYVTGEIKEIIKAVQASK